VKVTARRFFLRNIFTLRIGPAPHEVTMSFTTDLRRSVSINRWATFRSAAVNRLNNMRALATVNWPTYRDTTAGLTAEDKSEVDADIALIGSLAAALTSGGGGDAAGQTEIDNLLNKFNPTMRERTPSHAAFLIAAQQQAAVSAKSVREARGDLRKLKNDLQADLVTYTALDVADVQATIKAVNEALDAIAAGNASAYTNAIDALKV